MANPLAITPHAAGAEVATGQGPAVDIGSLRTALRLLLEVSAVAGTDSPSLVVALETSANGLTGWRQIGAFDAVGATAHARRTFAECERYIRAAWTITGTGPSFTFELTGEAHVLYASPSDVGRFTLPPAATEVLAAHDLADGLLRATSEADDNLASAYTLPLTAWGESLRGVVADMGGYYALKLRGFDPDGDPLTVKGHTDGLAWLRRVARREIRPPEIIDSTPTVQEGGFVVTGKPRRGW